MNFKRFKLSLLLIAIIHLISCTKRGATVELSVSSSEEHFTADGGTREISVVSNAQWIATDTSWWSSTIASTTNGKLTLLIQANVDSKDRTTTVSVTAGPVVKQIKIIQLGKVIPTPAPGVTDSIAPDQTGMRNLSSIDLAKEMKSGWNVGNSLEAIGGETAWGNPKITQRLIDSIKAAGFNAVRIPVAWSRFSDAATFKFDTAWMGRVEEVVNYVLKNNMYAIVNIHWDNGWMQPTYAKQDYVNNRLSIMWRQIAIRFRNYDDHLLFAGTNEVMVDGDYSTPKTEYYTVQNSFNQPLFPPYDQQADETPTVTW